MPQTALSYGFGRPSDDDLRVCGDLAAGRRAVVLGLAEPGNPLVLAGRGAKVIVVDPDPARIADLRRRLTQASLTAECHVAELADLGVITSSTVDLVLADPTVEAVEDLPRMLRQVHRILQPGQRFVVFTTHPYVGILEARGGQLPFHAPGRTVLSFSDWVGALVRANFKVDAVHELAGGQDHPVTLVLRARKEGA